MRVALLLRPLNAVRSLKLSGRGFFRLKSWYLGKMFLADAYVLDRQETRAVEIALVGRIQEETAATFDLIDDGLVQFLGDGGATFAAAEKAPLADMFFADIVGRVYDDRPAEYIVVQTLFFPIQA